MGLFDRIRARRRSASGGPPDLRYLYQWATDRVGVEGYVEPQTAVTPMTIVLVAADGQWTRRPAGGPAGARRIGKRLGIPVYDVQKVGYPQRMRDHDARQRILRRRAERTELDEQ